MKPVSEAGSVSGEARGIRCRSCGSQQLKVVYTCAKPQGLVMRRRECRSCGQRLTTWEREIGTRVHSK